MNKTGLGGINILPTNDRYVNDITIKDGSSSGKNIPLEATFHSHTYNIDFNNTLVTQQKHQVQYTRIDTISANTTETLSNTQGVTIINLSNYPLELKSYKLYFGIRFK